MKIVFPAHSPIAKPLKRRKKKNIMKYDTRITCLWLDAQIHSDPLSAPIQQLDRNSGYDSYLPRQHSNHRFSYLTNFQLRFKHRQLCFSKQRTMAYFQLTRLSECQVTGILKSLPTRGWQEVPLKIWEMTSARRCHLSWAVSGQLLIEVAPRSQAASAAPPMMAGLCCTWGPRWEASRHEAQIIHLYLCMHLYAYIYIYVYIYIVVLSTVLICFN